MKNKTNSLEQVTDILLDLKRDIKELKALRDGAVIISFKEEYQKKVTEKVIEYNSILERL